jgi:ectoine hydroxylase-related dioxygenase (phytanoyl-CoA dioxygenase family)
MSASAPARSRFASFRSEGFAVLEGFLHGETLERVRREVAAVLARPLPAGCERPHNTLAPLRWDDGAVAAILSADRRMAAVSAAIGADDLRWISAYVSVKQPHSAPLWWHQDWWCWDHPVSYRRAASQVAVLCYLSDTSERTAALRVLPGSHRRSVALHAALPEAHAREALDVTDEHPAMRDHPGQATLELRAGDAAALDYRLLHGTHPNLGAGRRECVLLSFAPSWRRLPDDVRAHLIRHPALPTPAERAALGDRWPAQLLPHYHDRPRDLRLSRAAPAAFATCDE